jgi:hypothetical protein
MLYFQTGRHLGFPSHPLGGVAKCEALNKMLMCLKKNFPKITNTYMILIFVELINTV